MTSIAIKGASSVNEYEELIKVFLRPDQYMICDDPAQADLVFTEDADKDITRRQIFRCLSEKTGYVPDWGILTGIRPVKLFGILACEESPDHIKERPGLLDREKISWAYERLTGHYLVSTPKAMLTRELYEYQNRMFGQPEDDSAGIYIGIPFCPTRCLYCSFASNPADEDKIKRYLEALHKEIDFCGEQMKSSGFLPESLYVGGGTPTSLSADQLDELLSHAVDAFGGREYFDNNVKEFCVEAGRPDTIDDDKIAAILKNGAGRISINPQTMNQETLKTIGRDHSPEDIAEALKTVRRCDENDRLIVNADIIAGLPGEDVSDIENTLEQIIELGADNITVHSLAVKRASRLKEADKDYHYSHGEIVSEMIKRAQDILRSAAYRPYYLYRQKHMSGAQENTGYCLEGTASIYNVRIMDEHQRIIALGAGGISKAYDPKTRKLERVANVTNQEIYVQRIDEMLQRKKDKLFV